MATALMLLFAYLLGSIPTGFLLGSFSGIDIRKAGSGNVGATNVARVVGKKQGVITLLVDVAKGFIPVLIASRLGFDLTVTGLVALAALVGHLYPVFLKFQGGKGVATALGIFLAIAPLASLALVVVFAVVMLAWRWVSLASMTAAGAAPLVLLIFSYPSPLVVLGLMIALLIIFRHQENIRRLRSGAEPKFEL
ncbi:MAG TPA: glycerol-3-phosphate 1-O-acyltransferase PlsY [Candidatus Binatia bacterium]|jgi:glycerol-3-phosphate acyltransferase PlsY|nr:glycerol-3-phosphate 1-O-acyltransferase PlsY [Candidatus Binatia bacterium]